MNLLKWLELWFDSNCDGDWEHDYGVKIQTLDNPGWSVRINLIGTDVENKKFNPKIIERDDHNWVQCRVNDGYFEGFGGVSNLEEILGIFKEWATQNGS